jgi:hypothetical protein
MAEICHLIGNGDSAQMYSQPPKRGGIIMTCNLPPYAVYNAYATAMVDYKMMRAIREGSLQVPGDWILGWRPADFLQKHPDLLMRVAPQIREYYTVVPQYIIDLNNGDKGKSLTDFSCGHMAAHYMCQKFRPAEIHLYGFDSIFNFDLRSCSDFYLESTRDAANTARLTANWRPIWPLLFDEFPSTNFVLHGAHKDLKITTTTDNVDVMVH